jgi:hypothetical protein
MEEYENSLVLISSPDEKNQNIGTGFIIDQDGQYSYILTCAHVVRATRDTEGRVKANNVIAEVVTPDTHNGVDDLAVLRAKGLQGKPLTRRKSGNQGDSFTSRGYHGVLIQTNEGSIPSMMTLALQGTLEELTEQKIQEQESTGKLWRLNITGATSPERGCSGAPIVVKTQEGEHVIGVLSMQQGKSFFATPITVLDRIWSGPAYVPFTNREDEIKFITSSLAPAYFLLDAPAGYGKSMLLQRLQEWFSERSWCSIYLVLDSPNLDKLVEAVAKKLSIQSLLASPEDDQDAAFRLGATLQAYWNQPPEGFILLLDLNAGLNNVELLEQLVKEFIPNLADSLKRISLFSSGNNRFRVVMAGRYLALSYNDRMSMEPRSVKISPHHLTPFKYDVIHDSSLRYLKQHNDEHVRQIAYHILFFTGGHPRCMARMLHLYQTKGMPPERFVERYSDIIWDEIVKPVVDSITAEFPTAFGVHKFIRNNVLRYMEYTTVEKLIDVLEISEAPDADAYFFSDKLRATTFYTLNNRLLHDDIIRRLMCLGLRNDDDKGERFVQLCRSAQAICKEHILNMSAQNPEMWAIECLFQTLQQHALNIQQQEQRQILRTDFFEQDLPEVCRWLVTGRNEREQKRYLLDAIKKDWEFQFTVNYYLRIKEYDDSMIKDLLAEIDRLLPERCPTN